MRKAQVKCPKCENPRPIRKGFHTTKKNTRPVRRYHCKPCKYTFITGENRLQKKPGLNKKIAMLYCEGNTLRGISRLLSINYKTVDRKFRIMAERARKHHSEVLDGRQFTTSYVQIDEMLSYEHGRDKPLGIQLSIRPKTLQIISAKVGRAPITRMNIHPDKKAEYNKNINTEPVLQKTLLETKKVLNKTRSVMAFDGSSTIDKHVKLVCPESIRDIHSREHTGLWRLNHTCAKLRHHLSRLRRKTWANTKKMERLQMHLDLFIAYQNGYDLF